MIKQQHTIKQKIQELLCALNAKDPVALQSHLQDISQISKTSNQETLEKLKEKISLIVSLQSLQKRRKISQKLKLNKKIIEIVAKGQDLMVSIQKMLTFEYEQLQKGHSLLIDSMQLLNQFQLLSALKHQDFLKIREQLYLQILSKLQMAESQSDIYIQHFGKSLNELQLPLKKDEVRKQQPVREYTLWLLRALQRQSCILSLKKQIYCLLQKQEHSKSKLLEIYWAPAVKAALYHFTNGSELHNLQEPGWMFQYLQDILSTNYKYIHNFVLKHMREEIAHSIGNHFLSFSAHLLLNKVIQARVKEDLLLFNPFLSFTFLEELSIMEDKLFGLFGLRIGQLQSVLIKHQILLHKALQYENERFQIKIFQDFININYSQINLKNIQAYNLMVAFLNLLDRLYRKYHSIKNTYLLKKIHRFYRERIMVLVAHLKTSFERIYDHSRLPKLDILISFKRTQNQLRTSLANLAQADSELQDCLQKQYYCFLEQYYEACALQALTSVHKKLHISLVEIIGKLQSADDSNFDQYLLGFAKIHQEWASKMDQICKFSKYVDNKLRNIFFTYLQATCFSLVGLGLFLKIFEPYLQVIFNEERHRNLIALITTQKERYLEQFQAQPETLAFLTQDQRNKLTKFKNANPNL